MSQEIPHTETEKTPVYKDLNLKRAVIVGFVLTLLLTFPTIFYFFSDIPGKNPDTYQAIARTTMVQQKVQSDGWMETLRWQKDANFWGLLPLIGYTQVFLGQFGGYNLWWLLSFFLGFVGMWVFVKDVTDSDWAAGISGYVFAFAPFHFSQAIATNIGTMHYEWLAWMAFFLHRFFRSTSWRSALGVAASLLLIVGTEHQLLAFSIIFLLFYVPFLIFSYPESLKKKQMWLAMVVGLAAVIIAGTVQFHKIWEIAHSSNNYLKPPYSQVEDYSADPIDLFLPSRSNTLWGEKFNSLRENLASNPEGRQTFYLGYLAIILAILGLFKSIKNKEASDRKWEFFFFCISLLFIVLSFGPSLHWKGSVILEKKLPYYLLYQWVPYWNFIRASSRIYLIGLFGWAFVVGIGAKYLEQYFKSVPKEQRGWIGNIHENILKYIYKSKNLGRRARFHLNRLNSSTTAELQTTNPLSASMTRFVVIFTTIFFVGLPIEFLSIPVPAMETNYSDFYKKLSEDKDQYSILEIPGSTSYEFASYTLYAGTIHKKTKIDGMDFARTEKDRWSFQKSTPIIDKLLYSLPTGGKVSDDNVTGDIVTTDYTPIANSIFNFYNIRYITIGKFQTGKKFDGEEIATTTDYIENKLHFPSVYEDDYLKAFQVPDIEARGCILTVDTTDDNWSQKEGTSKSRARWAKTGAKLNLVNLEKGPINVQVNFKAKIKYIHYMNVLLNGQQVANIPFKEFNGDYTFTLNSVPSGENVIELQIEDNEHNPQTTYEYSRGIRFSQFETFIK